MNTTSELRKNIVEKIKLIRKSRRISQQQVADAIGISRSVFYRIESGNRSISTLVLADLARFFSCPIEFFLKQNSADKYDLVTLLYFAADDLVGQSDANKIVDRVKDFISLYREGTIMKRELGLLVPLSLPSYENNEIQSPSDAIDQGELVADQERHRLGIGQLPITDVSALLARQDIWASTVELPGSVSGIFVNHPSVGMAILVNSLQSYEKQRFSFARVYAHALFGKHQHVTIFSRGGSTELIEMCAESFAEAFIMPRESVADFVRSMNVTKKLASQPTDAMPTLSIGNYNLSNLPETRRWHFTYRDVAQFAIHFGASYQSVLLRLQNLGYVSRQRAKKLHKYENCGIEHLVGRQMRDDENCPQENYRQTTLLQLQTEIAILVIQAFLQGLITRGKLIELRNLMGIESQDLLKLAETIRINSKKVRIE